ncbi:MAG: glycosyltransferase family A protein [Thermoplasmata archaeon]
MEETPRISVIVTAHNRRNYLRMAVDSVLNQTFPRDRFETIVFKNFADTEMDAYLSAHSVRSVTSNADSRVRTLGSVLREATGEILCFIDDDDLFAPNKLEVVDRVFGENPSLGYFHNDFVVIDDDGKPFVRAPFLHVPQRIYLRAGDNRSRPLPPNTLAYGINCSSISVRRTWLPSFASLYEAPEAEWADLLILCSALVSGYDVLVDPAKLTYYRYHDSWTNIAQYALDSVQRIASLDDQNIAVLKLVERFSSHTPIETFVRQDLAYLRFHRSLFSDASDWKPRTLDFVRFVQAGLHQRNYAPFYLIPLHLLSKISPIEARKTYFRLAARYRRFSFRRSAAS